MRRAILTVLLLGVIGCSSELDDQLVLVDQEFYKAGQIMLAGAEKFRQGFNENEESRYRLASAEVDRKLTEWLDGKTDASGRLVSTSATGEIVPLRRSDLELVIRQRDELMLKVALDHKINLQVSDEFNKLCLQYKQALDMWIDEKVSIHEKRKNAAALTNQALQFLISSGIPIALM